MQLRVWLVLEWAEVWQSIRKMVVESGLVQAQERGFELMWMLELGQVWAEEQALTPVVELGKVQLQRRALRLSQWATWWMEVWKYLLRNSI